MPVRLDERSAGADYRGVQSNRRRVPMQIKSILAAAAAIAFMIQAWTAIAAQDSRNASEKFILQARAGDMPETNTRGEAEVNSEDAAEATSDTPSMTESGKSVATVSVRSTRPQNDPHKDARVCLNAGNNDAIIRCAEKYRYR
jgi:hypothetical protein